MLEHFGFAVLRTHLLPFKRKLGDQVTNFTAILKDSRVFLDVLRGNKDFESGLLLSSPGLYREYLQLQRNIQDFLPAPYCFSRPDEDIIVKTAKYFIRMSCRCTPYGISAGVSLADISTEPTRFELAEDHTIRLKLSYELMVRIAGDLVRTPWIPETARLYTNSTMLKAGDELIFIIRAGDAKLNRISVRSTPVLEQILGFFRQPKFPVQIFDQACPDFEDFTREELEDFISELVQRGILLPDIYPSILSNDPPKEFFSKNDQFRQFPALRNVIEQTMSINDRQSWTPGDLEGIAASLKHLAIENVNPLHADLYLKTKQSRLSQRCTHDVTDTIIFLSKLKSFTFSDELSKFSAGFTKKYGDVWVPLLEALDEIRGIKYPVNARKKADNELLKGFNFQDKKEPPPTLSGWDQLLLKKYFDLVADPDSPFLIELNDQDVETGEVDYAVFPATLYACFSVLKDDASERPIIDFHYCGTHNSMRMLSRFANLSAELKEKIITCYEFDRSADPNVILAEIAYTPLSAAGNVTQKSDYFSHYIPIFNHTAEGTQIYLDDIYLSVTGGRIVLFSREHSREIIPQLSTSHNYNGDDLSIYHFLSELAYQESVKGLYWNWGAILSILPHKPRVVYKNVVLSKECWQIRSTDLDGSDGLSELALRRLQEKWHIGDKVNLKFGDDQFMFLDLSISLCRKICIDEIKKRKMIIIEENLYLDDKDLGSPCMIRCNEYVLPLKNPAHRPKDKNIVMESLPADHPKARYYPAIPSLSPEWLQINLFTNFENMDLVLLDLSTYLKGPSVQYFFIRYNDPEEHLRLRIRTTDPSRTAGLETTLRERLNALIANHIVSGYQLDVYERETGVYGAVPYDKIENFFILDSRVAIRLLEYLQLNHLVQEKALRSTLCVLSCMHYLSQIGLSGDEQDQLLAGLIHGYKVANSLSIDDTNTKKLARAYKLFHEIIKANDAAMSDLTTILKDRHACWSDVDLVFTGLSLPDRLSLAERIMHLSCNRLLDDDFNLNELVIYNNLSKLLKQRKFLLTQATYNSVL